MASRTPLLSGVTIHPTVLLSVVDHYNRIAKDTRKRVVGILLGEVYRGRVDVTNSFAVPFEEDLKDPSIYFLNHNYLETMYHMFKKVNAKEVIVGWYSTGPRIKPSDIDINEIIRNYTSNPVLVIVDVKPKELGLPVESYYSIERPAKDGEETRRVFEHIPSDIGALEAEEVGVEHLLRDINDPTVSTLAEQVKQKMSSLQSLKSRLEDVHSYLIDVVNGRLPPNNEIIYNIQAIFNLLPNLSVESFRNSIAVKTNDMHLVIYLSAIIRSIIVLHNLINNKIKNRQLEAKAEENILNKSDSKSQETQAKEDSK